MPEKRKSKHGYDILIACHCQMTHYPLYLYREETTPVALIPENYERLSIRSMQYIDTDKECHQHDAQYNQWNEIPDNSVDLIWSQYCPLGTFFYEEDTLRMDESADRDIWDSVLNKGWRILRPGGSFVAMIRNYPLFKTRTGDYLKKFTTNQWEYLTTRVSFHIGAFPDDKQGDTLLFLVKR